MSVTSNPGATHCLNFDDSDTVVEFEIPSFPCDKLLLNRIQRALLRPKGGFQATQTLNWIRFGDKMSLLLASRLSSELLV